MSVENTGSIPITTARIRIELPAELQYVQTRINDTTTTSNAIVQNGLLVDTIEPGERVPMFIRTNVRNDVTATTKQIRGIVTADNLSILSDTTELIVTNP